MRANTTVIALALLAGACGSTPEPRIEYRTVEVQVPIARSCVPQTLPAKPDYRVTREALVAAPDAASRLTLAVAGLLERDARLVEVEPVVDACRD